MEACRHCGSTEHAERACPNALAASSLEIESMDSMPMKTTRAHPASKPFRDCRAQLSLAMTQREEDPARVWLELVSIRENASKLPLIAVDDPILLQDIERFRAKLEAEIFALTQDVGDEVLAPLWVWVDLIRRRNRLDRDIIAARNSVKAARASRGDKSRAPRTEQESAVQLEKSIAQHEWWTVSIPPRPSPVELALWQRGEWDGKRGELSEEPMTIQKRGAAARAALGVVAPHRVLGENEWVGSKAELVLVPMFGVGALAASIGAGVELARDSSGAHGIGTVLVAVVAWLAFGIALALGIVLRRRLRSETEAVVDAVWYWKFFHENAQSIEVEVAWLRTLRDAFHARRAFDEGKGEGKQIEELKKWRPDLRDFVVEVAKQGEEAESAMLEAAQNSMQPPPVLSEHPPR